MRIPILAAFAASLILAGCSERTQDNAEEMVKSAAADAAANTEQILDEGADAAGNAADNLDQKAAQAEADVQDEPVAEAQAD